MENKQSVKPKITKSISKKVANLILKKDFASKSLGIELIDISPGKCQLEMIVKKYVKWLWCLSWRHYYNFS